MSLDDNVTHRARFQERVKTVILEIEDLRDEIMVSQQHQPLPSTSTNLGWADFHLVEATDELRRASSRIGQI
jgi:hypothetical protein